MGLNEHLRAELNNYSPEDVELALWCRALSFLRQQGLNFQVSVQRGVSHRVFPNLSVSTGHAPSREHVTETLFSIRSCNVIEAEEVALLKAQQNKTPART
jgi:hypothetical protein